MAYTYRPMDDMHNGDLYRAEHVNQFIENDNYLKERLEQSAAELDGRCNGLQSDVNELRETKVDVAEGPDKIYSTNGALTLGDGLKIEGGQLICKVDTSLKYQTVKADATSLVMIPGVIYYWDLSELASATTIVISSTDQVVPEGVAEEYHMLIELGETVPKLVWYSNGTTWSIDWSGIPSMELRANRTTELDILKLGTDISIGAYKDW